MITTRANAADTHAIHNIDQQSFTHPWSLTELSASIDSPIAVYLVAKDNDNIMGYIGFFVTGDILNIAVGEEYRRRGTAKLLINSAIAVAKSLDMDSLVLEVRRSNTAAICLYEGMGFNYVNTRKNYYDGVEDALIYIFKL